MEADSTAVMNTGVSGAGVGDHPAAGDHSGGYSGIEPQLDALVVGGRPGVALDGDAKPAAGNIEA